MFKTLYPHILDVKISNKCYFECSFCYENSHRNGIEVHKDFFIEFAKICERNGLIELSIGGGDPSFFYGGKFIEVINEIVKSTQDIIINVTTYNYRWVEKLLSFYREKKGRMYGIGFSVHDKKDLDKYKYLYSKKPKNVEIVAQHVVGTIPYEDFIEFFGSFDVGTILLLGYKYVGRGLGYKNYVEQYNQKAMRELILNKAREKNVMVSLDSLFCKQYPEVMLGYEYCLTDKEGLWSMYIDMVYDEQNALMAISSYHKENKLYTKEIKRDELLYYNNIIEFFKSIESA